MTNSTQIVIESNLSSIDKTRSKKCTHSEKSSSNQNTNSLCSLTGKSEVKSTVSTQQVLKKSTSKTRTTRKHKKSLDKKKQETVNAQHKITTDKINTLDECKHKHLLLSDSDKTINKENNVRNINKNKIASPNHKLTEYFSGLEVNEHVKDIVSKEIHLEKEQAKDNKNLIDNTNHKQSPLGSLKNSIKTSKQHKSKINPELTNHKVTEYFHVRRSERKYNKKIIDEKQTNLENLILNETEDGLKIKEFKDKGRGIVTTKEFYKGDFVIEYIGDLINGVTAKQREKQYSINKNIGCYMYYFKYKNIQYCIDATEESGKLGRLINHSRKGNLVSRIVEIKQIPHLILFAKTDISIGTEILYDYGDRSQESVRNYPWLTL